MRSNLFILTGPSGAGEDSIILGLKKIFPIEKIVNTTTRAIRPGEIEGHDYYFISREEFLDKINKNEFFEWAEEDNKQLYGSTLSEIERVKNSDKVGIWKMEYQGVIATKKLLPDVKSIFIYIPMEKIKERLIQRGNCTPDFIAGRLEYAKGWFENEEIFDYKVENVENKLDETIEKVANIIKNNI